MGLAVDAAGEVVWAALDQLDAAYDTLSTVPIDALTHDELLTVMNRLEITTRRTPSVWHRILARLAAEASPVALGARTLREVLAARLRISRKDARRRLSDAAEMGQRTSLTGQPMAPLLAATAAAQAAGTINGEHVQIITGCLHRLPHWVDVRTREQAEADLVRAAVGLDPDALRKVAERLLALIDQDGPAPDDGERARRRYLHIGRQGADGMTPIKGNLGPQALATLEPILAKWAAPGMCNPDDPNPCVSGTPSQEQIDGDARTVGQRNHDALIAIGRSVLSSGELGQHNGLPVTVIVSTTLQELESAAGCAVTGGGSLLPMSDVIRMATHAHHYLAIFDQATNVPLHLFRDRRCASPGQRIVLHARDRGCTKPGCPVSGYHTQVHHIIGWANGGQTNIDLEVLACPADNRLAETGWNVRINDEGIAEWIPPPELDTGQDRTNTYHHPNRILTTPDDG